MASHQPCDGAKDSAPHGSHAGPESSTENHSSGGGAETANRTSPFGGDLAVVPFVPRPLTLASHDGASSELVVVGRGVHPPVAICPTCRRPLVAFDVFDDDVPDFHPALATVSEISTGDTPSGHGGGGMGATARRDAEKQSDDGSPHVAVEPYSRRRSSSTTHRDHHHGGATTRRQVWTPMYFRSLGGSSLPDGELHHSPSAPLSYNGTPRPPSGSSPAASENTAANQAGSDMGAHQGTRTGTNKGGQEAEAPTENGVNLEATAEELLMQQGYYARHFSEVHRIGGGSYGAVYLCRHVMEHQTLGLFAVKKIPVGDDSAYFLKVLREVRVMEEIKRHPNVLEYHHSWIDYARTADFGPVVRCLFVLMEYATEGSLDEYLERRHGASLTNAAVWYFFLSALAGLAHLHSKNILHRDLKPQNLLLTMEDFGRAPRLLVADFGAAALLGELSLHDRTGGTGTLEYMAPELLVLHETRTSSEGNADRDSTKNGGSGGSSTVGGGGGESNASGVHLTERFEFQSSKASDVWSLGMVLHYLACDATLPTVLSDGTVLLNVDDHSPIERPPEMKELLRAMLNRDPTKRPTCAEILQAPYIRGVLRSLESIDFSKQYDTRQVREGSLGAAERARKQRTPLLLEDVAGRIPPRQDARGGKRRRFTADRSPPVPQSPAQQSQEPTGPQHVPPGMGGASGHRAPSIVERWTQTDVTVAEAEWKEFIQWRSGRGE